jgi:beta-glucosidase
MIKGILGAISTTAKPMVAKTALVLKDNAGVAMDPALLGAGGPAILEVWFPGQEDGHIVADLLFGVVNPSGKSPVTFPKAGQGFMDWASTDPSVFPGIRNVAGQPDVQYKEGLNIGYRWYDANGITPAFPFGHGLSYTTFSMSGLSVTPKMADGTQPISIEFFLENTGTRAGAEVPQLYLGLPFQTGEPPKRLVAFDKVWLNPGERTKVKLTIDPAASNHPLSVWNSGTGNWSTVPGFYPLYLGRSSADIALRGTLLVRPPQ